MEKQVKNYVKKVLDSYKKQGLFYYMPAQNMMSIKGIPDFIICYKSKFLSIETKRESGGIISKSQLLRKEDIENSGGIYEIIDGKDSMDNFNNKYLK